MADIKVLDDLVAVNLDINLWTARRKMTASDLGGANLPPADLASLGSKRVCDPAKLAVFSSIRARTFSMLDRYGIRFLGGWAIPSKCVGRLTQELDRLKTEFDSCKSAFLLDYDNSVEEWIKKHPEWSEIIRSSVVSGDYVRSRLNFGWQMFKVAPTQSSMDKSLDGAVDGLADALFGDVSKTAKECWDNSFVGENEVSRRSLSALYTILNKLKSLSFVDPKAGPAADIVETALQAAQGGRGKLRGTRLMVIQGVLNLLINPKNLYAHCEAIINGTSGPANVVNGLATPGSSMQTAAPERQEEAAEPKAEADEKAEEPKAEPEAKKEAKAEPEEDEDEEPEDAGIGIPSYGLW